MNTAQHGTAQNSTPGGVWSTGLRGRIKRPYSAARPTLEVPTRNHTLFPNESASIFDISSPSKP